MGPEQPDIFPVLLCPEVPAVNEKIKSDQREFGGALLKIQQIRIGILGVGILKVNLVNQKKKKKISTWRRKGSRRNSVLPAGKSLPISSSLRQGWIRVWTSISTAVRFPKKTTDKNIIWILDRFRKVSALLKKKILWEP